MCDSVNGKTKVTGIFGHPVDHSLSPRMQNAALRALGLNIIYVPFDVKPVDLGAAMKGVLALDMVGVNLTHPHKVAALEFLDEVNQEARSIGAVNTVVNRGGRLVGYNTDGTGFLRALREEHDFDPRGNRVIVFGAGGAARAICRVLNTAGPERLVIVNRSLPKAEEIAAAVDGSALDSNDPAVHAELSGADLVINTTPVPLMFDAKLVKKNVYVYDIGYARENSPFMKAVKERGGRVADGLGMLLHQGAEAFELWTGRPAPVEVMRRALMGWRGTQPIPPGLPDHVGQ